MTAMAPQTVTQEPKTEVASAETLAVIGNSAFEARNKGLPKSNPASIENAFDAYRAYELGWYRDLSEADFVELMDEEGRLGMAHAMGQDMDWHCRRLQVIDEIIEAGNWTIDMDTSRPARKNAPVLADQPRG